MKKMFLAATLLVALTSAAFADGKKSNEKMLNDLKTAIKTLDQSAWVSTESFQKATFTLNGKEAHAFLTPDGGLVGFSVAIEKSSLPEGTMETLAKKYDGWQIINPIMFISEDGNVVYYVQANKNGKSLALHVSDKGKVSIYDRIPS
jgi:hypothetical protein